MYTGQLWEQPKLRRRRGGDEAVPVGVQYSQSHCSVAGYLRRALVYIYTGHLCKLNIRREAQNMGYAGHGDKGRERDTRNTST